MRFASWYFIFVGVLMFAQWGFFLAVGAVPELQTEPFRIGFHLAGEFFTALCLIIGGAALLQKKTWGKQLALFAAGALAYTAIVSPGYFAQQGEWPLVVMFSIIIILNVISAAVLVKTQTAG